MKEVLLKKVMKETSDDKLIEGRVGLTRKFKDQDQDLIKKNERMFNNFVAKKYLEGHSYYVSSVAIAPSGDDIVSGSDDNTIIIWDAKTGEKIRTLEGHRNRVSSVAIAPSGDYIVSGSWDNTIIMWDAKTGENIRTIRLDDYNSLFYIPPFFLFVS